jgi:hypothetical protein
MNMLTPVKAIRLRCLDCSCYHIKEVRDCDLKNCHLYEYRMGKKPKSGHKRTSLKAIRLKCLDCCLGQKQEVRLCPAKDCSLYLYRFGKNPKRTGIGFKNALIWKKPIAELRVFEGNTNQRKISQG